MSKQRETIEDERWEYMIPQDRDTTDEDIKHLFFELLGGLGLEAYRKYSHETDDYTYSIVKKGGTPI